MTRWARTGEDREARRAAILEVTRALCAECAPQALTMAMVARRANLAKGTLYLYFDTKEGLLLALLERLLEQWSTAVRTALDRSKTKLSPQALADLFVGSLTGRPLLSSLLVMLDPILAPNVPIETMRAFKSWLREMTNALGTRIDRHVRGLRPGHGVRLLVYLYAAIIGLRQAASPVEPARGASRRRQTSGLEIEMRPSFCELVVILVTGFRATERSRA